MSWLFAWSLSRPMMAGLLEGRRLNPTLSHSRLELKEFLAHFHSFPQVSLRQVDADDWHFCGASVIGPRHILTAAHCTVIWDSVEEVEVVVGEHDRSVDEGTEQRVKVTKMTVHESYGSPKNYENDIAIWEVAEDIVMNEYVAAVALPDLQQESTGACTVSGWGTLRSGQSREESLVIMKVTPIRRLLLPHEADEGGRSGGGRGHLQGGVPLQHRREHDLRWGTRSVRE